ncbi:MAG: hypothetical protein KF795_16065 [Labilithrix sp.]|nr:hypothetical protein [Labilithrix sp.]
MSVSRVAAERREWLYAGALLALGTLVYALFVVQDFSGPLIGGEDYDGAYRGDANYFEFLGYYVRDHYHFGLKPISFFTKDVAYPSGTHIGLLSWCAERDLFNALLLKLVGPGPWIQTYVTLGAALGAVGITAILRGQFGVLRASLVGFAASFMSFYAWYKYPYHLNISALHWVTMSIAADAVTMRLVIQKERLSLPFIALRAALLVLSLGLDLGYVAGHALTSFVVTLYCAWAWLGQRDRRILGRLALALPERPLAELRARPAAFAGAAALLALGLFVYVPFVAAVVRDTTTYPMTDAAGNFWASQFHALFPYLPGTHPNSSLVRAVFGKDEGVGEYAPGFALLIAAGVGIWLSHKRGVSAAVKPLLVTALLVFAFHPRWCKTLQIFPWFAYNRVAGRGTIVLPVLLALIGVSVDAWPRLAKRLVAGFAVAEFLTATFLVNEFRPARLSPQHTKYFETVAAAPGAALLEWPFCIASANSVITRELCPYYERLATAYANRRFHKKATVSVYLSRVHKTQFKSWLDDGWEDMFMPDDPNREHPKRELRCFSAEQWARFDGLYRNNDFAGIQLYADLLPDACVRAFHERYGEPTATETLPRLGRVEFIPRGR